MFGRNRTKVPQWAFPLDEKRFTALMQTVEARFAGQPHELGEGFIRAADGYEWGLANLAQMCAGVEVADVPTLVTSHFNTLAAARAFRANLNCADFDSISQYLALRVYPDDWVERVDPTRAVSRPIAGELCSMVVYDFPDVIENIDASHMAGWGKTLDELMALGKDNVRAHYPLVPQPMDLGGIACQVIDAEHVFASNIVFEMDAHPGLVGVGGALVALPTRNGAIVYPIVDLGVLKAVQLLATMAQGIFNDGPGSLTPQLFWYHDGQFEWFNCQINGRDISAYPSDDFTAMLNSLAAPPA